MTNIKKITAPETYLIRQLVLRKGKPIESCSFEDDDLQSTTHLGLFLKQELIGVISLYEKTNSLFIEDQQCQIRGMAILEHYRKKGFGKVLINYCEKQCNAKSVNLIWFNARIGAIDFYEKMGYQKKGSPFEIKDVGEHLVMFKKLIA